MSLYYISAKLGKNLNDYSKRRECINIKSKRNHRENAENEPSRFLQYEKRLHLTKVPKNFLGSFLLGFVFFLGWMPCIDPILGTILGFAATKERVMDGVILLSFYSLGLGLPFILAIVALGTFLSFSEKIKRYFRFISIISGTLIIGIGILMIAGYKF